MLHADALARRVPFSRCSGRGQGHVNNAVFSTFMETGRVDLMVMHLDGMPPDGCALVIANLTLDFRGEIRWRGEQIGTRVARVGRGSTTMDQAIFQGELCAATAQTTLVIIDAATRRSAPFDADLAAASSIGARRVQGASSRSLAMAAAAAQDVSPPSPTRARACSTSPR